MVRQSMTGEADGIGRRAERSAAAARGQAPRAVDPGARWAGLLLYALAAAAAAVAPLALEGEASVRALRETAPLAALIGGVMGFFVVTRWPRTTGGALAVGFLSAFVAFVFFSMLYLFGEALITAFQGGEAGAAIAGATGRLWARLPMGALSAVIAFGVASLILRAIGASVLAVRNRRSTRSRRR